MIIMELGISIINPMTVISRGTHLTRPYFDFFLQQSLSKSKYSYGRVWRRLLNWPFGSISTFIFRKRKEITPKCVCWPSGLNGAILEWAVQSLKAVETFSRIDSMEQNWDQSIDGLCDKNQTMLVRSIVSIAALFNSFYPSLCTPFQINDKINVTLHQ